MSDQLFVGVAPTAPAGREIFFHSHDDWLAIATCVLNKLDDEFQLYSRLDDQCAMELAKDLKDLLDNGTCRDFYEWYTLNRCSAESQEEAEGMVDRNLMLTRQFAVIRVGRPGDAGPLDVSDPC